MDFIGILDSSKELNWWFLHCAFFCIEYIHGFIWLPSCGVVQYHALCQCIYAWWFLQQYPMCLHIALKSHPCSAGIYPGYRPIQMAGVKIDIFHLGCGISTMRTLREGWYTSKFKLHPPWWSSRNQRTHVWDPQLLAIGGGLDVWLQNLWVQPYMEHPISRPQIG